ncbi:hypothetical protein [Sporichthya sp.]|uniref:hypothetical protein n=1 Tax=Sporichthya sp. TaxID=65475 RepID=UPI001809AC78|nr:hypothetical protein [Sporichthya sp.]MBA3745068.1 hypothetical protein [Sporichthya sp.]
MFGRIGVVALALMLGGCADGDDDSDAALPVEPGATSSGKAASDSSFDKDAARALAKSALFVIGDFPAGWGATPADPDTEDGEELQKQLSECLDAPSNLFGEGADGVSEDSSDFNSPDEATTVSSSVSVAAPGRMRQFFDVMKGENVSGCLSEAMNAAVQAELKKSKDETTKDMTFEKPKVGQLSFPTLGDETVPLRVSMTASYAAFSFDFYLDLIYIRSGDNGVSVTFEGTDRPVSIETEQQYAEIAAERLAGLPGSTPSTASAAPSP